MMNLATAVVVDLSTEMASVALLHSSCSGDGSVDRDGVSGTVAVELTSLSVDRDGVSGTDAVEVTSLAMEVVLDLATETASMALLQSR